MELTGLNFSPRTFRRDLNSEAEDQMPYLARLADRAHHYGVHDAGLIYMDMLDWALSDLEISHTEKAQLTELAIDVGLTSDEVRAIHQRYLDELIEAALRDNVIQESEKRILEAAAGTLDIEPNYLASRIQHRTQSGDMIQLEPGLRVCFTGSATREDGSALTRDLQTQIAGDLELAPVGSVTKRGCDLLVAADPASQSGKARHAREYGIPIASVDDFLLAQPNGTLPTT